MIKTMPTKPITSIGFVTQPLAVRVAFRPGMPRESMTPKDGMDSKSMTRTHDHAIGLICSKGGSPSLDQGRVQPNSRSQIANRPTGIRIT
jgi:hypothetical protein